MAEFDWWLLIVGIVAGGGLVALVLGDSTRHDEEIAARETEAEATWIADRLSERGASLRAEDAEAVLRAHRAYLRLPPPDGFVEDPQIAREPRA